LSDQVKAWAEIVKIPTYGIGTPDKNPMFFEKRVYQGSSGVVYPHPVIDRVFDEKADKDYTALFLENHYLKIMILPELGGRVQMALDKTNGCHFIYYNRVIKPALVGLAGPWISGGIEFNWPQHHRPSTFDPLDWVIEEHMDGSSTVWCAEIEHMYHTKGMHGFTLYPERAYLEIRVQLYNRTSEPQSFLWWTNPAVAVHDETQSVFPPDVHAVMDHGKRDVSSFPIARGIYYKVDYSPGTDISRYKNIPVPTSFMAYHSDFDFMGDYDHRAQAGMLHVADHHLVPGKKQWTWGNGEFGQAWDRQLTDQDGPYIELMCGAFTDNQPDFSWIQPGEEKTFRQVFMPYKKIGPACNANENAVLNLHVQNNVARIGVYSSAPRRLRVQLVYQSESLYDRLSDLDPEEALLEQVDLPASARPQELTLRLLEEDIEVLSFTPLEEEKPDIPAAMLPARPPEEIDTVEELFLNALHLEQYRHATLAPEPYYQEALRRDPEDSRCNNAMGLLLYRRGKFAEAEAYFRAAIRRLTLRNPNPYDGEPSYNLGLALKYQGRYREAYAAFYKAAWNGALQDAAYFELACLSSRQNNFFQAIEQINNCLARNGRHHRARHLKIALLRRTQQVDAARRESSVSLELDALDYGALWERWLLDGDPAFKIIVRADSDVKIALSIDYAHAGLFEEGIKLLESLDVSLPLAAYTLGWILSQAGQAKAAREVFQRAAGLPADYCFPNRLEDVLIFEAAQRANPADARAPYYLGNFWYAHRRYDEAIDCWERASELDPTFPTVQRNLGLAYFNKRHDPHLALAAYERAFSLNPGDARVLFELDQLHQRLNDSPTKRLGMLHRHLDLVEQRDDLTIEFITLLNLTGQSETAYRQLMQRNFHPWEGGEGKVTEQYVTSLLEMSRKSITAGDAQAAIHLLEQAQNYPPNLGEGKLYGAQENHIFFELGRAYETLGEPVRARAWFERASEGLSEPTLAIYYNDQPPEMIYYQGLAHQKLGHAVEAYEVFNRLVAYGAAHMDDEIKIDYFAVSLPDFLVFDVNLKERNQLHCHFMMGVGFLGLGEVSKARSHFEAALAINANHLGAGLHLQKLSYF
jgi:tetratricopeptide (TPR) repeat protein